MNTTDNGHNHEILLTEEEMNTVSIVKIVSSVLSLLGSTFIIIMYVYLSIKTKSNKSENNHRVSYTSRNRTNSTNKKHIMLKMGYGHDLIFLLSLSDFLYAIAGFIKLNGFTHTEIDLNLVDTSCKFQGILINFAEISSICWTSMISFSIYLGTFSKDITKMPKVYFYFFIYAYGVPLILTILPMFTNSYGPAGAWCWMNTQNLNNHMAWVWSLVIYIFNWSNIIFNIFAVIKSINYFKIRAFEIKEGNQLESNFLKNFCIVLKFFPMILIVDWIFPTINRIYTFSSKKQNVVLFSLQIFFGSFTGFLNSIVYSYYYKTVIPCWCCLNNGDNNVRDVSDCKVEELPSQNSSFDDISNSSNSVDPRSISISLDDLSKNEKLESLNNKNFKDDPLSIIPESFGESFSRESIN